MTNRLRLLSEMFLIVSSMLFGRLAASSWLALPQPGVEFIGASIVAMLIWAAERRSARHAWLVNLRAHRR